MKEKLLISVYIFDLDSLLVCHRFGSCMARKGCREVTKIQRKKGQNTLGTILTEQYEGQQRTKWGIMDLVGISLDLDLA